MSIESCTHVHHIVSNVRGTLRPEVTLIAHEGGISRRHHHRRAKFRCMQIIAELEGAGAPTPAHWLFTPDGRLI
jgi:anthranilate synthase component 1